MARQYTRSRAIIAALLYRRLLTVIAMWSACAVASEGWIDLFNGRIASSADSSPCRVNPIRWASAWSV
jgi:hypothetical protein